MAGPVRRATGAGQGRAGGGGSASVGRWLPPRRRRRLSPGGPEEDERIELRLLRLSDILKMIEKGGIHDGKTLNAVLLYAWMQGRKRKK